MNHPIPHPYHTLCHLHYLTVTLTILCVIFSLHSPYLTHIILCVIFIIKLSLSPFYVSSSVFIIHTSPASYCVSSSLFNCHSHHSMCLLQSSYLTFWCVTIPHPHPSSYHLRHPTVTRFILRIIFLFQLSSSSSYLSLCLFSLFCSHVTPQDFGPISISPIFLIFFLFRPFLFFLSRYFCPSVFPFLWNCLCSIQHLNSCV